MAGPGLIALVGAEGIGKSYTLEAYFRSHPGTALKPRLPGEAREAADPDDSLARVELIDAVDSDAVAKLEAEPEPPATRVVAVRPDAFAHLQKLHPHLKAVHVHPMSREDIESVIMARLVFYKVPTRAFTMAALSAVERICAGNPGALDRILDGLLRTTSRGPVSADDVAHAAQDMLADATSPRQPRAGAKPRIKWFRPDSTAKQQQISAQQARLPRLVAIPPRLHRSTLEVRAQDTKQRRRALLYGALASVPTLALVMLVLALRTSWQLPKRGPVQTPAQDVEVAAPLPAAMQAKPFYAGALRRPKFTEWEAQALFAAPQPLENPEFALPNHFSPDIALASRPDEGDHAAPAPTAPTSNTSDAAAGAAQTAHDAAPRSGKVGADRLLALGKALADIGQDADAGELFAASAALGNREAASIDQANKGVAGSPQP